MRWLPSFSHSPSHSNPSTSAALKASSSERRHKKPADATHASGGWLFGTGKKSNRSRKLRPVGDLDGTSPPRGHDSDADTVMPLFHSPNSDRCCVRSNTSSSSSSSSVAPQPLPLPESSSSAFFRHKDGDCPLPSPQGPGLSSGCRGGEERDRAVAVIEGIPPGIQIRRHCFFFFELPIVFLYVMNRVFSMEHSY